MRSTKSSSQCSGELPDSWARTFVAVDDTHGVSIQVFETEEQAKAAAPPETGPGMGGWNATPSSSAPSSAPHHEMSQIAGSVVVTCRRTGRSVLPLASGAKRIA